MLSVKQGSIKNHFLSLWYESTWDWTQVSWIIGEHSDTYANVQLLTYWGYTSPLLDLFGHQNEFSFSEKFVFKSFLNFIFI